MNEKDKVTGESGNVLSSPYMYKYYAIVVGIFLTTQLSYNSGLFFLAQIALLVVLLFLIVSARKRQLGSVSDSTKEIAHLKGDVTAAKDQTRRRELTLEKQLKLSEFPLSDHFEPFMKKLKAADSDQIDGLTHTQFMELYMALEETFKRNNRLPLSRLADIPEDVRRVNQIETLIDLYGKKMQRVRQDDSLDEEDRDHKIANWERMMERDISKLEEA